MEDKSMRKLILAACFTMGVTSAALAAGGGGYNGIVISNVYEYLAAHGCPSSFGLVMTCGYDRSWPDYRYQPRRPPFRKEGPAGSQ
jgi:hypothetical protein